jgi:hypothetical protein
VPFLKRGVPHCGHVSWSIVAPDLRRSDIRLISVPTALTDRMMAFEVYYLVGYDLHEDCERL